MLQDLLCFDIPVSYLVTKGLAPHHHPPMTDVSRVPLKPSYLYKTHRAKNISNGLIYVNNFEKFDMWIFLS